MLILNHTIDGDDCTINFPEYDDDLDAFSDFLSRVGHDILAWDTEGTGLDIYSPDHRLRLVQFGTAREAWVLRADKFAGPITEALRQPRRHVLHNAPFDWLTVDRALGVIVEEFATRSYDTRILAHLLDPRAKSEGGTGHALKDLCAIYVDPNAPDTQQGLTSVFRSLGLTKATGWAGIPIDNETYVRYAGLDVILTRRLLTELVPRVRDNDMAPLSQFEHKLQGLLAILQRRGIALDVPYVHALREELGRDEEDYKRLAARYGVVNVNSTKQVASALLAMGEDLRERTATGQPKVDKEVLMSLADVDQSWKRIEAREPNPLADAVMRSKRAGKWQTTYAGAFLNLKDATDRLHPSINALQARTARMSISRPPLQQLPSSDWKIRRAFLADPGNLIVSSDYSQVEMRVLAGLSGDKAMCRAIHEGQSIHHAVAVMMFGPNYTPAQYKLAKNTGFGEVFGGGAAKLARQAGVSLDVAKQAKRLFRDGFPGIRRYSRKLIERAEFGAREVVTPLGRHLPLDRDRLFACVNYIVQSTARDILAQAIIRLFEAGLGAYLLLPIHDEILAQAPESQAEEFSRELSDIMGTQFRGLPIVAEADVYGVSWGHGYGAPKMATAA